MCGFSRALEPVSPTRSAFRVGAVVFQFLVGSSQVIGFETYSNRGINWRRHDAESSRGISNIGGYSTSQSKLFSHSPEQLAKTILNSRLWIHRSIYVFSSAVLRVNQPACYMHVSGLWAP